MALPIFDPAASPIDDLPVDLQLAARDLAWYLFQVEELPLSEARRAAAAQIADLLAYADEWDATAGTPAPEPEPTPPAPMSAAERKAAFHLAGGLEIRPFNGGYLVPSGTRGGIIHFVSADHRCSCEAGQRSIACWHVEAVRMAGSVSLAA